jgi:ribonuclease P protein component
VRAGSPSTEAAPARERLLPSERLKLRTDFLRVSGGGQKVHSARFLFLVLARGDEGPTRLGITVTRKVANAVGRNRIKRVLREVFRRNRALFPAGCDVVVIAKDRAPGLSYEDTRAEIETTSRSLVRASRSAPRQPTTPPRRDARPARTDGPRNQTKEAPVRRTGERDAKTEGRR